VLGGLVLLAFGTASDVVNDSFVHLGPPKVSADELDHFLLSHVTSDLRVVFRFQDWLYYSLKYPKQVFSVLQPVLDLQLSLLVLPDLWRWFFQCRFLFCLVSGLLVFLVLLSSFSDLLSEFLVPLSDRGRGQPGGSDDIGHTGPVFSYTDPACEVVFLQDRRDWLFFYPTNVLGGTPDALTTYLASYFCFLVGNRF